MDDRGASTTENANEPLKRDTDDGRDAALSRLERDLARAMAALDQPGSGAIGTLECRVADLQQRVLVTPARSLADIEARMNVIRDLVATLGEPGYLMQVVEATLADVRTMQHPKAPATAGPETDGSGR